MTPISTVANTLIVTDALTAVTDALTSRNHVLVSRTVLCEKTIVINTSQVFKNRYILL